MQFEFELEIDDYKQKLVYLSHFLRKKKRSICPQFNFNQFLSISGKLEEFEIQENFGTNWN